MADGLRQTAHGGRLTAIGLQLAVSRLPLVALFSLILSALFGQDLSRHVYEHRQMGTLFRIVLYADGDSLADLAAQAAFDRIDTLNALLSDYLPESELSLLPERAKNGPVRVSDDIWEVLVTAQEISRHSDGAFDITIGPLSKLWRRGFRRQTFPETEKIDSATELVGFRNLELLPGKKVCFKTPGMRLDAGGIAKGYAVDQAMAELNRHGINIALVDGGGDVLAGTPPPGETGWKILAKTVDATGSLADTVLLLSNGALATSGDTYKYLEWQGKRYSHIIDPRTGIGVSHEAQITVYCPSCTLADGIASAASVTGPDGAWEKLLAAYPDCRIRLIYPDEDRMYHQLGNLTKKQSKNE